MDEDELSDYEIKLEGLELLRKIAFNIKMITKSLDEMAQQSIQNHYQLNSIKNSLEEIAKCTF